jgi:saccharopine dehydrogenase-like NADP-dependent oxidoreductase
MSRLGFLDDTPLDVGGASLSPRQFLVRHLSPRLQFGDGQRDVVVLRVRAWGLKHGKERRVTYNLVDYRDLNTGLFAMNRTVGFTTSIGAQMILKKQIRQTGVLSPARDVSPRELLTALKARGMKLERHVEERETA